MGYRDLDELRSHWDEFAPLYAARLERSTTLLVRAACEHLRLAEAGAVLEVGAGPGAGALVLLEHLAPGARLVVTDIAPRMVELARARLPESVEVREANAEELPFADAAFDRYLANLNLMLVLDPDRALAEAHRVLRPGGLAAWSVWGRPEHSPMFTLPVLAAGRVGLTLPQSRSNFHLGGSGEAGEDRAGLRARAQAHGFGRVLSWYQAMVPDTRDGDSFADFTLRMPRWQKNLAGQPADRVMAMRRELASLVDDLLARGEPIGMEALMVVAQK
jgi:SAM-dependent methyltransferase